MNSEEVISEIVNLISILLEAKPVCPKKNRYFFGSIEKTTQKKGFVYIEHERLFLDSLLFSDEIEIKINRGKSTSKYFFIQPKHYFGLKKDIVDMIKQVRELW